MDGEQSIQQSIRQGADRLIDMRLSLSNVLGSEWKKRSIFPNVESALKDEGVGSMDDGEEVLPGEAKTDVDKFIIEANDVFNKNGNLFHVRRVMDDKGIHKAFITGKIGKDTLYMIAEFFHISVDPEGAKAVAWMADKIGFISQEGKVFSLDQALADQLMNDSNTLAFVEIVGRKYKGNVSVSTQDGNNDTVTFLPEDFAQEGVFFHEVGHLLRKREIKKDESIHDASIVAGQEYKQISRVGVPKDPMAILTPYQARKVKTNEERGAWAIGINLIKEAGREIGLDCVSPEALKIIQERLETALKTYDQSPYSFMGHENNKPIPVFSQEYKKYARKLHRELTKNKKPYKSLDFLDEEKGSIVNDPHVLLDRLAEPPDINK